MDEPFPEVAASHPVDDIPPRSARVVNESLTQGVRNMTATIQVACSEQYSARAEIVRLLRGLADDIETGLA